MVGGGIWGTSAAYHLAVAAPNYRIGLYERRRELAQETTRQSAGQIGQLRSTPLMMKAVRYTIEFFSGFKAETGHDPGFVASGSLHVALNAERAAVMHTQRERLKNQNIRAEIYSADDAYRRAAVLRKAILHGALHLPDDGYVDARQCTEALARAAEDRGVKLFFGVDVCRIHQRNGRLTGFDTSAGPVHTDTVILAAGPWTGAMARPAGQRLAVQPIQLQQARTVPDGTMPADMPVVRIPDQNCYVRPERGAYLFGGFDQDPLAIDLRTPDEMLRTNDLAPRLTFIEELRRRVGDVLPVLANLPVDQYRQGMVTCTPDGQYLLGPAPNVRGLWLATGCGAMGIAGSAAVGRWLSRWIADGDPGEDLHELDPGRFGDLPADGQQLRKACCRAYSGYYSLARGGTTYGVGPHPGAES